MHPVIIPTNLILDCRAIFSSNEYAKSIAPREVMEMVNPGNLEVPTLGPCAIESPLQRHWAHAHEAGRFVSDEDKILVDAGQEWFDAVRETDLSGNIRLQDIGFLLKERIERYFKDRLLDLKFKYIDPSYMIRGVPANPQDSITSRPIRPLLQRALA